MATSSYSFVSVPIGRHRWKTNSQTGARSLEIPLYIVSRLTIEGKVTEAELCKVVDANPIWTGSLLSADIRRIRPDQAKVPATLKLEGTTTGLQFRELLKSPLPYRKQRDITEGAKPRQQRAASLLASSRGDSGRRISFRAAALSEFVAIELPG